MRLYALSKNTAPAWIGIYLSLLFLVLLVLALSGCGTINAGIGAVINNADADAAAALQNQKAIDDRALKAWQTAAGALTLGALGRNDTGNPDAVRAALLAAGVNNIGVVAIQNGQVTITTSMVAPYAPASPKPPTEVVATPIIPSPAKP